jgi:hypothetical protein
VGVHGEVVSGLEGLGRPGDGGLRIAAVHGDVVLGQLGPAHVLPELGLVGEPFPFRPGGLELPGALDRCPLALGDDGEEAALAHDAGALDVLDGALVHSLEGGADGGRANHPRVEHTGHAEVLHVGVGARDLAGHVRPRHRLADDRVILRVLERRGRVQFQLEGLVADQLGIREAALRLGTQEDDAVLHREVDGGHPGLLHRHLDQRLARGGRRLAELHAGHLDGEAAPGGALIGGERGVALDQLDLVDADVQLLGHHLGDRDADARADVHLAGVGGDGAVLVDGEEAVDLVQRQGLGLPARRSAGLCVGLAGLPGQAEGDDEGPGADQELAAGRLGCRVRRHVRPPFPSGPRHA